MIIKAYQTLEDRDNIDEIETDGPFRCNRSKAWLGLGYYFWDTNMDWAIKWGEIYRSKGSDFVIGECRLDLSKDCFDLVGCVAHQKELTECVEIIKHSGKLNANQKATFPNLIQFLRKKGLFNYKSIRCCDYPKETIKIYFGSEKKEFMVINQRVQVCVIELRDVLLRPFSVVYPKRYLNL